MNNTLLGQFKNYLFSQEVKPSKVTVKNYLSDINHFIRWWESFYEKPFDLQLITKETIETYKKEVSSISYNVSSKIQNTKYKILSPRSLERHLSSLRKFFTFLKLEGKISYSPFEQFSNSAIQQSVDPYRLRDFKSYLYVFNASHLTIKNYLIDIKQFLNWAEEVLNLSLDNGSSRLEQEVGSSKLENLASTFKHQNPTSSFQRLPSKDVLNYISVNLLEEYKQRLVSLGTFSPATINRKLSSLRKYIAWAESEGLVSGISYNVSSIQEPKPSPVFIPEAKDIQNTKPARIAMQSIAGGYKIQNTSYSSFPPLRLLQKLTKGINLAVDATLITQLVKIIEKAEILLWKTKGMPIFTEARKLKLETRIPTSIFQLLNPASSFQRPISKVKNLPKELYAPLEISTKFFPWYKKAWHNLRYRRPNWYRTYHSYAITHYFHFAVLVIFAAGLVFGFYTAFIEQGNKSPTLAALPTNPPRILSFQGRLTDNNDNPITSGTNLRFAIYRDSTASGSALQWQEVNRVEPDTDGIFNVILGNNTSIPSQVFFENNALWLGVTVEATSELTPRQQIATVAFAANSETLQGLLPITATASGTTNVVLALNSSGNLVIGGSATPTFQATGGQFTITGQTVLLSSNAGSNGNIQLAPDGTGKIDLIKPLQNTSISNNIASAVGSVEIDDLLSVLATSSGQSALTINQTGAGPLISASASGANRFAVDNSGNISAAGGLTLGANTTIDTVTAGTLGIGTTNATTLTIGRSGQGITLPAWATNNNSVLVTGASGAVTAITTSTSGQCFVSNAAGNTPSWTTCPGGTNWWNQLAGALSPIDTTNDFLLGATATASADFAITGIGLSTNQVNASLSGQLIVMANNGWGGNATISGALTLGAFSNGVIQTTNNRSLTIGGNTTGNITLSPNNGTGGVISLNAPTIDSNATTLALFATPTTINMGASTGTLTFGNGGAYTINTVSADALSIIPDTTGALNLSTTNTGAVSIGNTTGDLTLGVDTITASSLATFTTAATLGISATTLNLGNSSAATIGTVLDDNLTITAAGNGDLILTSDFDTPVLIGTSTNTPAVLSISGGIANNAALIVNNLNNGDLIAASASGVTKFRLDNSGNASMSGSLTMIGANSIQTTSFQTLTLGGSTTGQVVLSGFNGAVNGITMSGYNTCTLKTGSTGVVTCGVDNNTSVNWWNQLAGLLSPVDINNDFAVGGTSTASAKFSYTGIQSGNTIASISGQLLVYPNNGYGGNASLSAGLVLGANANPVIQTTKNQGLTIGGNTTGNIIFSPNNTQTLVMSPNRLSLTGTTIVDSTGALSLNTVNNQTITTGTGLVTTGGDLQINGNDIQDSGAAIRITLGATTTLTNTTTTLSGTTTLTASSLATIDAAASLSLDSTTLTLGNGSAATIATTTNGLTLDSGSNTLTIAATDTTLTATGIATVSLGTSATINAGATALNLQQEGAVDVNIAGGSGTTGCTIINASGDLACSGGIYSTATTGLQGWWNVASGSLYPTNSTLDFLFGSQASVSARFKLTANNFGAGTLAVASISGKTSFASLVVNNDGVGDLFTASASGWTRFRVANTGAITSSAYTTGGGIIYATSNGLFSQTTAGNTNECLKSQGGSTPTWGTCGSGGDSFWGQASGLLYPANSTVDLAIGGTASTSAKFLFANVNSGTPTLKIFDSTKTFSLNLSHDGTNGNIISTTGTVNIGQGGGTLYVQTDIVNDSTNNLGAIQITDRLNVLPTATSNVNSNAALIVNNPGTGDIFTASAGGTTRFTLANDGDLTLNGGNVITASSLDTFTTAATLGMASTTTLNLGSNVTINSAATALNLQTNGSIDVNLAGGSGSTGCTIANSTGNLTCSGNISGTSTGIQGYWQRALGALSPTNITDDLLLGATSTSSSALDFSVTGIAKNQPVASLSGQLIVMPNNGWGGNVGIGNTSPQELLHVGAGTDASGETDTRLLVTNAGATNIAVRDSTNDSEGMFYVNSVGTYIGALTNHALTLQTNNAARVRIDSTGNVGIGTTSPTALLHVNGGYSNNAALIVNNLNSGDLIAASASGVTKFRVTNAGSAYASSFYDIDNSSYFLDPASTGTSLTTAGSVGIGTTTPNAKLSLGNNTATGFLDNYGEYQEILYDGGTAVSSYGLGVKASYMVFNSNGGYSFDRTGTATSMVIDTAGSVGIGTDTPSRLLEVYTNSSTLSSVVNLYNANNTAGTGTGLFISMNNLAGTETIYGGLAATIQDNTTGSEDGNVQLREMINGTLTNVVNLQGGNVGIGTTSPGTRKLDVAGTIGGDYLILDAQDGTNEGGELQLVGAGAFGTLQLDNYQGNVRVHTLASGKRFQVLGGSFYQDGTGDNNYFATSVGIGNDTPGGSLDIAQTGGYEIYFSGTGGANIYSSDNMFLLAGSTKSLNFGSNGTDSQMVLNSGNLTVTGTITTNGGVNDGVDIVGTAPTVMFKDTDNRTGYWHMNSDIMYLLSGANGAGAGGWAQVGGQWPLYINTSNNAMTGGGTFTLPGYVSITGAQDTSGNLRFSAANPYISASSYFIAPGGAYFNSGTVYTEAELLARGGIADDGGNLVLNDTVDIVGTTTVSNVLNVVGSSSTFGYLDVVNTDTSDTTGNRVLMLRTGAAVSGGNVRFIKFFGAATGIQTGTAVGNINLSPSAVTYDTAGADFAEYFKVEETVEYGDIISTTANGNKKAVKGETLIGAVSYSPGFVGNNKFQDDPIPVNQALVGIIGHVPTKVSTINGSIKVGDYITSSNIPGVGMKATTAGQVVGKAMEEYVNPDPNAIEKISVLVNVNWYDPDVYLTSTGDLNLVDQTATADANFTVPHYFTLNDALGNPIDRVGAFAELISADIRAGSARIEQLTTNSLAVATDNITIGGQSLRDYIATIVNDIINNQQSIINNQNIISPIASIDEIHTDLISPLANNHIEIAGDINVKGSATISGTIRANQAEISGNLTAGDASISGTLRAKKIIADQIEGLNIQAATVSAQYITNNYYTATASSEQGIASSFPTLSASPSGTNPYTLNANNYISVASFASEFAYVENLSAATASFSQGLMVFGQTTLSDTSVIGQLSVNGSLILADNSINVLGSDLNLQPLRQGGLSIMAGLIYIDINGNATFEKDVTVKGTLYANAISSLPGQDLTLKLASSSSEILNSKYKIQDTNGSDILSVNQLGDLIASGTATFSKLNLGLVSPALALSPTEVIATGSAGVVTLKANKTQVTVLNNLVTEKSLIYITPVGQTLGQNLYLLRQLPDESFTVGINAPVPTDIKFNFLIIN